MFFNLFKVDQKFMYCNITQYLKNTKNKITKYTDNTSSKKVILFCLKKKTLKESYPVCSSHLNKKGHQNYYSWQTWSSTKNVSLISSPFWGFETLIKLDSLCLFVSDGFLSTNITIVVVAFTKATFAGCKITTLKFETKCKV